MKQTIILLFLSISAFGQTVRDSVDSPLKRIKADYMRCEELRLDGAEPKTVVNELSKLLEYAYWAYDSGKPNLKGYASDSMGVVRIFEIIPAANVPWDMIDYYSYLIIQQKEIEENEK